MCADLVEDHSVFYYLVYMEEKEWGNFLVEKNRLKRKFYLKCLRELLNGLVQEKNFQISI